MHLATMLVASAILAAAGGGSGGFGGGGGGGGGGGAGAGGASAPSGVVIVCLVLASLVVLLLIGMRFVESRRRRRAQRGSAKRERAIAGKLLEAAEDDPGFDPDAIRSAVAVLFRSAQEAWDARDRDALALLVGDDLLVEWGLRLDVFARREEHSRSMLRSKPIVRIVGVTNRTDDRDDRIVTHVHSRSHSWVDTKSGKRRYQKAHCGRRFKLSQYLTLGRRDDSWILVSIEEDGEGDHHLTDPVVVTPFADHALADRTRTALAIEDAPASATKMAALVPASLTSDARATALDLALVDDRFSPGVLTAEVRAAVAAWVEAVDGPDDALERRATPAAVRALLYGDRHSEDVRTVVRGADVHEVLIDRIEGGTDQPRIGVLIRYRARWYREDRRTQTVLAGSRARETDCEQRCSLALTDDADVVWRIVALT